MKKVLLALVFVFAIAITTTSCKKGDKVESSKAVATEVYQCPMDCEKGKSYTEPGNCPVCKMALKAKKAGETKKTEEDHSGHNH